MECKITKKYDPALKKNSTIINLLLNPKFSNKIVSISI